MVFTPQFLDELKYRFTLSDVVGRTVKLVRRGREHTGLCPFHSEKTPSFTVNDQKGFYHCFGCGEHGTIIDFVMKTQGLSFPETIEDLAGQVGMDVPRPSREDVERQKERASLSEVMEAVVSWYEAQFIGAAGKAAWNYVKGRGLSEATIKKFRIGYAPDNRSALKEAMQARGIHEDQLIETGMLINPEDGGKSYDRFRGRVMFPISDRRGRVIAFGGRALSSDVRAKYLNSPETSLFHKGATLYNWANARAASYDEGQVLVVEGYMDVIALAEVGINHAVAPLGTALTEEQIAHLWQMADEPILSFDGDKAGIGAAHRALDRALPMLRAGKSLRFVILPDGDDPDTLVMAKGRGAMDQLCDTATPLVDMLWQELTVGVNTDTPERRAGFEKKVFMRLADIQDENVKKLYQREFRQRIWDMFRANNQIQTKSNNWQNRKSGRAFKPAATGLLSRTSLGRMVGGGATTERLEKLMVLTAVHHPEISIRHEETLAGLALSGPTLSNILNALMGLIDLGRTLEWPEVEAHLIETQQIGHFEAIKNDPSLRQEWFAYPEAALSDALTGFEHVYARYQFITSAQADYKQAEGEYAADMTPENHERFVAAQQVFRDAEEKIANIDGFGLESGKLNTI